MAMNPEKSNKNPQEINPEDLLSPEDKAKLQKTFGGEKMPKEDGDVDIETALTEEDKRALEKKFGPAPQKEAAEKSPLAETREAFVRKENEWNNEEDKHPLRRKTLDEREIIAAKKSIADDAGNRYSQELRAFREELHKQAIRDVQDKNLSGKEAADALNEKIAEIIVKTVVEEGDALYTERMRQRIEGKSESAAEWAWKKTQQAGEWYRKQPRKRKLTYGVAFLAGAAVAPFVGSTVGVWLGWAALTGRTAQRVLAGASAGVLTEAGIQKYQESRTRTKTLKEFTKKIHLEAVEGKTAETLGSELLEALKAQNADLDKKVNQLGGSKKTRQQIWRGAAGAAVAGAIIFGIPAKIARAQEMREAAGAVGEYAGKSWRYLTESIGAGESIRETVRGGLARIGEWLHEPALENMEAKIEAEKLKGETLGKAITKTEKAASGLEKAVLETEAAAPKPAPEVTAAEKPKIETPEPTEMVKPPAAETEAAPAKVETLIIGRKGPEGALIQYFSEHRDLAKSLGWEEKADLKKWAGTQAHRLWLAHANEALKNTDTLAQLKKLGYSQDMEGYAKMMRRIGKGFVALDPATGKMQIVDTEYLKARVVMPEAEKSKTRWIGAEEEERRLGKGAITEERITPRPADTLVEGEASKIPETTEARLEEAAGTSKPAAGGEKAFGELEIPLAPEEGAGAAPESIGEVKPLTTEQLPKLGEAEMLENEQKVRKMLGFGAEEYAALKNEKVGDFLNKISSAEEGWERWKKGEFGNINRNSMRERIKLAGLINRLHPAGSMQRLTISQFLQMVGPKRFT